MEVLLCISVHTYIHTYVRTYVHTYFWRVDLALQSVHEVAEDSVVGGHLRQLCRWAPVAMATLQGRGNQWQLHT